MYHLLAYAASCIATVAASPWQIPEKCKPVVDTSYFSAIECAAGAKELMRDRTVKVICFAPGEGFPAKPPEGSK